MAKLSARGRTEVIRLSKESQVPAAVTCFHCEEKFPAMTICESCKGTGKQESSTSWEKVSVVLMSDRTLLRKRVVIFRFDNRRHDYGWTVSGKVKPNTTREMIRSVYEKIGYSVER